MTENVKKLFALHVTLRGDWGLGGLEAWRLGEVYRFGGQKSGPWASKMVEVLRHTLIEVHRSR